MDITSKEVSNKRKRSIETAENSNVVLCPVHKFRKENILNLESKSKHKVVNQRSKDVMQAQQQTPESLTVTLTWHAD